MLSVHGSDASRAVKADWVELSVVADGLQVTDADYLRTFAPLDDDDTTSKVEHDPDAADDGEYLDSDILDSRQESQRAELYGELAYRQGLLGELYPFDLSTTSTGGWVLSYRRSATEAERIRVGRLAYLTALLMASFRHQHIVKANDADATFGDLLEQIHGQFQLLSVLAATHLLGHVYWFGWPRPDGSDFKTALADLVAAIGHGRLKDPGQMPANRKNLKDGTIDLVAWKPLADDRYGSLIVYGQVASGNNWKNKSVGSTIAGDFLDYFQDSPALKYLEAIFIPFVLHTNMKPPASTPIEKALVDEARYWERNFGTVIDRPRLVQLAAERHLVDGTRYNTPELRTGMRSILRWTRACTSYCRMTKP